MFIAIPRSRVYQTTGKFPKLPKLDRYKVAALVCGFVIWFGYGLVIRSQYQPVIALLIGLAVSYGPLAMRIGMFELSAWLMFSRKQVTKGMMVVFATQPITMITVYLESWFVNDTLILAGFTEKTFLLPSVLIFGITWAIMPYLWFKKTDHGSLSSA